MHNLCLSLHTRLTWSSVCCICGRSGEASDVEVNNIENYGDDVEAMLLLGATPDIELDENSVDDDYHDYVYGGGMRILLNTRNCTMME